MSQLVPYSQPNRNVGLLDSFRLAREDRQANAELERLTRRSAMTEVYAEQQAMHEARAAVRRHDLQVGAMLLHESRPDGQHNHHGDHDGGTDIAEHERERGEDEREREEHRGTKSNWVGHDPRLHPNGRT